MISVPTIKAALVDAFTTAFAETADPNAAMDAVAQAIAECVADGIKRGVDGATITITAIPALVSPAGPVTGTITFAPVTIVTSL